MKTHCKKNGKDIYKFGSLQKSPGMRKIKWPYLRLHTIHTSDFWYGTSLVLQDIVSIFYRAKNQAEIWSFYFFQARRFLHGLINLKKAKKMENIYIFFSTLIVPRTAFLMIFFSASSCGRPVRFVLRWIRFTVSSNLSNASFNSLIFAQVCLIYYII